MVHYAYKITNKTNNKFYVGVHSTQRLKDGYWGSGKIIKRALKKYGKHNFTKEILQYFVNKDEMYAYERELITEEFLQDPLVYNIAVGGNGASIAQNRKPFTGKHTAETKARISAANKGRIQSEETKAKARANSWARKDPIKQREHARYAASISKRNTSIDGKMRDDVREKISRSRKEALARLKEQGLHQKGSFIKGVPKPKISCPHCHLQGGTHLMHRWHFDNCKQKHFKAGLAQGSAGPLHGQG